MVPEGWSHSKLEEVLCRVVDPVEVDPTDTYQEIGIRSHGKGIFHKEPVQGEELGNKRVFWVKPACFIVNIVFAWEQAVARTTKEEVGKIASHRFPMYRSKDGAADVDFLTYYFKTPHGKRLLELASPGGAGRNKTLGQKEFGNIKLLLPPGREQQKIARILSTWDKAIATVEKLIENSKAQKKALMQQLLTGKVRLPGFQGTTWERVKIYDLVTLFYGKSPKEILDETGPFPILGTGGVTGRTQTPLHTGPAVILGRKGTIDKPHYVATPFWAIDTTFFCLPKPGCVLKWFFHVLHSINLKKYNEASGVPSLGRETIYSIRVLAPHEKEQEKIATTLTCCDEEIAVLKSKLHYLHQEKTALMQQLLTGKRRVNTSGFCEPDLRGGQ